MIALLFLYKCHIRTDARGKTTSLKIIFIYIMVPIPGMSVAATFNIK